MPNQVSEAVGGKAGWWAALGSALIVVLLASGWMVMRAPLDAGDAYPPYSSLRTDPLGTKAFYESLQSLPEVSVSRAFRNEAQGGNVHSQSATILLGLDPVGWPGAAGVSLSDYEKMLAKGGRLVIGFLPVNPRRGRTSEKQAETEHDTRTDENDLNKHWDVRFVYRPRRAGEEVGRLDLPRHTALSFMAGQEWTVLADLQGLPVAIERPLGAGTVVLISETYPLSNEGLRDARDAKLLAAVIGPAREIVFDENHLGVSESGSVAGLMRKYHLEGAVGVLLIAALLFMWRNATSFLPPLAPLAATGVSVGRDAHEGMAALLRRTASEKQLIETCVAEWSKLRIKAQGTQTETGLVATAVANSAGSGPVETYRAICRALAKKNQQAASTKNKMTGTR